MMFPRIVTNRKKNGAYKYLVISESIRKNGKSTTRDIASFGNIARFSRHDVEAIIDGLIKYKIKFSERGERHQIIPKATNISTEQKKYFNMIEIKNPSNLEPFLW